MMIRVRSKVNENKVSLGGGVRGEENRELRGGR